MYRVPDNTDFPKRINSIQHLENIKDQSKLIENFILSPIYFNIKPLAAWVWIGTLQGLSAYAQRERERVAWKKKHCFKNDNIS